METPEGARPLGHVVAELSRPRGAGHAVGWVVSRPGVGAWTARAMRAPMRARWLSARVTRLHAWLLRRSRGRLRRSWLFAGGQPVMSLTTTGRRTGATRTTAVAGFVHGDELAIAGMNLGRTSHPGWAYNLMDDPRAVIELEGQRIPVIAQRATGASADRLWRRWVEVQPSATEFRALSGRDIPIFVLRGVE